jgi:sugar phosphate isomerase/epimerase
MGKGRKDFCGCNTSSRSSSVLLHIAIAIWFCAAISGVAAATVGVGPSFKGPCGLVLYSVRDEMVHNPSGALDAVGKLGFHYVEVGGTRELSPTTPAAQREFLAQLAARNLKAVSCHFTFERLRDDIDGVIRDAQNLGVQYVCCAGISHQGKFDEKACREGIDVFNRAGEALAKQHLTLCYHPHGFEFEPAGSGTLFDKLISQTNPNFVSYEMDVFWIHFAGQDPVQLLKKYSGRWKLMHLKDMKKGDTPPKIDLRSSVALGSGQLDMPALLRAAKREGVKYYFIEDESPDVLQQLPLSLAYLEKMKW